jgi:hypothetical protein
MIALMSNVMDVGLGFTIRRFSLGISNQLVRVVDLILTTFVSHVEPVKRKMVQVVCGWESLNLILKCSLFLDYKLFYNSKKQKK